MEFQERKYLRNIRKGFEVSFESDAMRKDSERLTLANSVLANEDIFVRKRSANDMNPEGVRWEELYPDPLTGNQVGSNNLAIYSLEKMDIFFPTMGWKDLWIHHCGVRACVKIGNDINGLGILVRQDLD